MKRYKILDNVQPELNIVTLRAVKFYKEHKFFENDITVNGEFFDFLVTPETVVEWCKILFKLTDGEINIIKEKYEDINFEEVFEAHTDFFIKLNPPLRKAIDSIENLSNSVLEKITP